MSIIYEALKKIESSNLLTINLKPTTTADKTKKGPTKIKIWLVYLVAASLGIFIANISFKLLIKPLPPASSTPILLPKNEPQPTITLPSLSPQAPIVKKVPGVHLVLNGIFFSEEEAYALINNQIVKVGDTLEGLTVKRISVDEVELESEGSIIKLPTEN